MYTRTTQTCAPAHTHTYIHKHFINRNKNPRAIELWLKLIGMNSLLIMWVCDSPPQTLQFYSHGIIIIFNYWEFCFYFAIYSEVQLVILVVTLS